MITYIINTVRSATDSKGFEIPFCSQWQHLELNNLEGSTPPLPPQLVESLVGAA